jgi:hypothetical protein
MEAGFEVHLVKPVDPVDLNRVVSGGPRRGEAHRAPDQGFPSRLKPPTAS